MGHQGPRRLIAFCLAASAVAGARADSVRGMTAEKIRDAITWGENASDAALEEYDLHQGPSFVVNCDTPFLRVAQLARAVKGQNGSLDAADLSPRVTEEVLNLYVHARFEPGAVGESSFREVEYVTLSRPRPGDGPAEVTLPTSFQSYVRRVPVSADYEGPTRLARSVKAVFPLSAFSPESQLKIRFQGGATQVVKIDAAIFARVR